MIDRRETRTKFPLENLLISQLEIYLQYNNYIRQWRVNLIFGRKYLGKNL